MKIAARCAMAPDGPTYFPNKLLPAGKKILLVVALLALPVVFVWNVSLPGRSIEGCPVGCVESTGRSSGPLRVLSLNMLHGFPRFGDLPLRLDLIAAEIRRLGADVALLQEVPWTSRTGNAARSLAQRLGYNYVYYRANGNRWLIFFEEGEAILSRFPLSKPVFAVLRPRAGFFENRVVLGATAATPWGEVTFYVAHLSGTDPQVNRSQVESLREFVERHSGGVTVVAGDFNAREDSPQIVELAGPWIDAFRAAHPAEAGPTCCVGDLTAGPGEPLSERIDYLFLVNRADLRGEIVRADRVFDQPFWSGGGWQWASDHAGLLAEIGP